MNAARNRHQQWWDEKVILGLTRNDLVWVVLSLVVLALYIMYPINWDWVFGLRP